MLFDGLILLVAVVLAVNGWKRGLIGSWRGPIAMLIATVIVQRLYIDFSAWVVSRLRVAPEQGVIIGYLMLWFSLEAVVEILFSMLIRGGVPRRPAILDRLGGAVYGLLKAVVIVVLPLMAASADLKIPPAPIDKSGLVLPGLDAGQKALLVPGFASIAKSLLPIAGAYVVSEKPPSFTPVYDSQKSEESQEPPGKKLNKKELENLLK